MNPTTLLLLTKPVISDVHMPEASLNSLIVNHSSDGLAIITIDSSGGALKADILKHAMPPN
jgi:hypothetical protein